jgi:RNA polymerase sigma-70 factor (ECF subfamily)
MRQAEQAVQGNQEAFEQFFERARPALTGYAFLMTGSLTEAHELAQETLARAWSRWDRVQHYDHQDAWARKVLRNLVIADWRRSRRRELPLSATITAAPGSEDAIVAHLDVTAALRSIPLRQRHAIVLHDFVGLTIAVIAKEMGVPQGTVKAWLSRGRAAVAERLRSNEVHQVGGG